MSDKVNTFSHMSHGLGEHVTGRPGTNHAGDITHMAPKKVTEVMIHDGMRKISKTGQQALGAAHADALDSLSGLTVVPGAHGAEATAHPLIKAPVAKGHLGQQVEVSPGMRSRTNEDCETHADKQQAGRDMLASAVRN